MGADLFEDKFDGAVWALDHLLADPLPPPGPNRPEMDADLHQVLMALVEHGHEGPFQVLGAERCAFLVLRSDWSWLRSQSANLGLDEGDAGAEPRSGPAGSPDGAGGTNGVDDADGTGQADPNPDVGSGAGASDTAESTQPSAARDTDVAHVAGRADVFADPDGSGRADPADVADGAERSEHADGTDLERSDHSDRTDRADGVSHTERPDPPDRPDRSDSPTPSPFPSGRTPVVETEADLERALAALDAQGFPDRAFALCREGGRKALAAVLSARAYDRPSAWLAEHAPKKVLRGLLSEVVMAVQQVRLTERVPERSVNSGFLPDIGDVRSRRRARSVRGEKTLTLPTSVRRVVRGEHGTRVETEVVLPKAENSRTLEGPDGSEQIEGTDGAEAVEVSESLDGYAAERGSSFASGAGGPDGDASRGSGSGGSASGGPAAGGPASGGRTADGDSADGGTGTTSGSMFGPSSGPHTGNMHSLDPVVGPRRGVPGQLATIRWEGFSRAWDDLGNRYVMLFEVEKGQPGLSWFLGMEVVTQTLFPALDDDATQLMLLNPGHLVTRAPTIDGQVSGRPSVRTVPDGNVVTVNLRKQRKRK